ncbi:MAG: family 43 glycosylhydrolase, partial [Bacteroidota bacterium]
NYLVIADNIEGPWSEPIYLNSSGFDPSMYHDDDGRKWFLNMLWDYREGVNRFAGIKLQEYDPDKQMLVGEAKNIWKGSGDFGTEAPHLYKHNGYYYLMVAEGGTEWWHKVIVARSKNIWGPYETDPQGPCITSVGVPENYLQKAGHGSLVETQNGELYVAHLVGRPIDVEEDPKRRCILGRETAIQKMEWTKDGWLRMTDGTNIAKQFVEAPNLKPHSWPKGDPKDEFDQDDLSVHFNSPRLPITDKWASLEEDMGKLTIRGRESLISIHNVSMIARRVKHFKSQSTTSVEFEPNNFQEMAGLVAYYDERDHYALLVTHDDEKGKILKVTRNDKAKYDEYLEDIVELPENKTVHLRAIINYADLQFSYSLDGKNWTNIGPVLDSTILSDDYDGLNFTGAFTGMFVGDYRYQRAKAQFDYFEYSELK